MNFQLRPLSATLLLAVFAATSLAGNLGIGSPAPAITVAKWIKGKPVKLNDGGIHVVEFWATWCGPCKDSIPHLTELARKFKGKVDFTGVSAFEQGSANNKHLPKVEAFVKSMGSEMEYNVAADGELGTMASNWMKAAGQSSIPTAFVVGRDGKILWIGHPMIGLEETLNKVVAGTYDAADAAAKIKAKREMQSKLAEVQEPYQNALQRRDMRGAVKALDNAIAKYPELEQSLAMDKFSCLLAYDEAGAQNYAAKLSGGILKDDGVLLNDMAWAIVDEAGGVKKPNLSLALKLAERANQLTGGDDPYLLDTLALAQFRNGKVADAVKTETKAVTIAKAKRGFDAATLKELSTRLAKFKAKQAKG